MSEKKEIKPINKRLESTVIGLFLISLALMLGLNVGKIARTLVFPLIYFLGGAYYLILIYMAYRGVMRIVLGKRFKYKNVSLKIGLVFLFIASIFMVAYATYSAGGLSYAEDGTTLLNNFNAGLSNYYGPVYLNTFEPGSYWGAGLIGLGLGVIFASNEIMLALAIVFYVIAFILVFFRFLSKLISFLFKKGKENREEQKKKTQEKNEERKRVEEEERQRLEEEKNKVVEEPKEQKIEVQFGFEPESISFDEDSTGFNQIGEGTSLDDSYAQGRDEDSLSDFYQLAFDGQERKFKIDSSDEFVQNSYFEQDEQVNKVEEQPKVEEPKQEESKIDLHDDNEPRINLNFDELEPNFNEEPAEEKEIINLDEEYHEIPNEEDIVIEAYNSEPVIDVKLDNKPFEEPIKLEEQPKVEEPVIEPIKEEPKKRERVEWIAPSSDILEVVDASESMEINRQFADERLEMLNNILAGFKVGARCVSYTLGNNFTRFNIEYDANVSVKTVEKLVNDISMRLGGVSARFVPYVSGEAYSGLEVSNEQTTTVGFKEIFDALPDATKHPLAVGFGKDLSGKVVYADFNDFPHLLVAGTTGSGKSIYIHSIISTLIMRTSPDDLKLVLVDPKKVEMVKYRDMPHLLCPIITEASKAKVMMSKLVEEMERRYEMFADTNGEVTDIKGYNKWAPNHDKEPIPYIIAVLDEYADLVDTCKEISQPVVSIAQKARACGIHMLISTQRPSTNVITGVIKGNLPTHVALSTSSYTDSMTILGEGGAEKLNGRGDMLVQSPLVSRSGLVRLQGCYIQGIEISRIVGYLKQHYETHYDENFLDLVDHSKEQGNQKVASGEVAKEADEAEEAKYQAIKEWVMTQNFVSMSKIQRECQVGFNRAGRFFNRLQREGIVSTQQDGATKGCKVLVHDTLGDDYIVTSEELTDY